MRSGTLSAVRKGGVVIAVLHVAQHSGNIEPSLRPLLVMIAEYGAGDEIRSRARLSLLVNHIHMAKERRHKARGYVAPWESLARGALLVPQRLNRIEPGGLPRRIESEQHPHDARD